MTDIQKIIDVEKKVETQLEEAEKKASFLIIDAKKSQQNKLGSAKSEVNSKNTLKIDLQKEELSSLYDTIITTGDTEIEAVRGKSSLRMRDAINTILKKI